MPAMTGSTYSNLIQRHKEYHANTTRDREQHDWLTGYSLCPPPEWTNFHEPETERPHWRGCERTSLRETSENVVGPVPVPMSGDSTTAHAAGSYRPVPMSGDSTKAHEAGIAMVAGY